MQINEDLHCLTRFLIFSIHIFCNYGIIQSVRLIDIHGCITQRMKNFVVYEHGVEIRREETRLQHLSCFRFVCTEVSVNPTKIASDYFWFGGNVRGLLRPYIKELEIRGDKNEQ